MTDNPSAVDKRTLPFRWYGSKYTSLHWLLDLLPSTHTYVEPFAGSASVLINREPSPVEVLNDKDGDVVNFFEVLREKPDELLESIALTPFSREEYERAILKEGDDGLDPVEKARAFFVRAGQSRSGLAQSATPGRWAYCKSTSRRGMSGSVSRWCGRIDNLDRTIDRLRRVQIENRDAADVIETYDGEDALIYCDPPYPHESRSGDTNVYVGEMSDDDHRDLSRLLKSCEAKVAVSSRVCPLMEELYGDWNVHVADERNVASGDREESEALYTNYTPGEVRNDG
jgi:DNA adenine methylase